MAIINNEDLTVESLPARDDARAIYIFAHSIGDTGGYDSFQEAHDGVDGLAKTLTELRMELYFAAKTYDSIGLEEHVDVYNEYYDQFVKHIMLGQFD